MTKQKAFFSVNHSFILKYYLPININELSEKQSFKWHFIPKKSDFNLKDRKNGNFIWFLLIFLKNQSQSQTAADNLGLFSLKGYGNNNNTNGQLHFSIYLNHFFLKIDAIFCEGSYFSLQDLSWLFCWKALD